MIGQREGLDIPVDQGGHGILDPAPDAPPVETPPVDPALAATDVPVEDVPAIDEPVEDTPVSVPGLPGQPTQTRDYSPQEVTALQQYVQQAAAQMQQYQQQLQQYQMAELSDEERAQAQVRQQSDQLSQREAQLNDWYARNQWYQYYNKWVPEGTIQGDDPVAWQHSALAHLYESNETMKRENAKLTKEVEALRKATQATPAPKVSTQGGAPVLKKALWDMSWEEMTALKDAALLGQVGPDDYPSV
jgi:hypothetical protein